MGYLLLACRAMLAGVFVVSLVGKVRSGTAYAEFHRSVVDWRIVPRHWARAVASGAVAGEGCVVVLLALPGTARAGFLAGALLLVVFTLGIAVVLRRAVPARCRCFGAPTAPLGPAHLLRNLLLLALCATGAVAMTVTHGQPSPDMPGAVLALSAAAVGVLVVVRFHDVVPLKGR